MIRKKITLLNNTSHSVWCEKGEKSWYKNYQVLEDRSCDVRMVLITIWEY